jgi:hypothetical protein
MHRHLKLPGIALIRLPGITLIRLPGIALGIVGILLGVLGASVPDTSLAEPWFRGLHSRDAYLAPLDDTSPGLPPAWRLKTIPSGSPAYGDPTVSVTIDPLTGMVREDYRQESVEIREPLVTSDADYTRLMTQRTTRRLWRDKFRSNRSVARGTTARGGGLFRFEVPVKLPTAVTKIIGKGAPSLEVYGSETIKLTGKSDWTPGRNNLTGDRKGPGAFPSFEMQQDLNVNVTGTIGDKIKVDVDQSSNVQSSLDNKVKLRYEGDEDDMIKTVELGNTNLSLQGASFRQEGLFGVKTAMKFGNLDLVTIASRQEGKNETSRFTPSGEPAHITLRDLDYVKLQYFLLADHYAQIDFNTLQIWKDDGVGTNNDDVAGGGVGNIPPGYARLNPTQPADSTNPQVLGRWEKLIQDIQYTIKDTWWDADSATGFRIPVVRLTSGLQTNQMLAVSYVERTPTGDLVNVGYGLPRIAEENIALGKSPDTLLLKMIRPRQNEHLRVTTSGDFDSTGVWYPVLPYELRNFYYLGAQNVSTATMELKIRKRVEGESINPDHIPDDPRPLIEILGLDQVNSQGDEGLDGRVDPRYVDAERGVLFFPDITPFDPTGWPGNGCRPGTTGFLCLNDIGRNVLRRNPVSPQDQTANPLVYYRANTRIPDDVHYYIEADIRSSRQGYYLGKFNILEGSEQVRVNGILWQRITNYTIDYETGQIQFLTTPPADASITVDYSFAPGAGQVQRTLAGISLGYNPSADHSFSSSILYESKGAQEELVKLGEEPATSMIGDLSTVLSFRPVWMTQLANVIPGVSSSAPSSLNFQGSLSASIPDPNTKGEAYVDDMEGNRESNTLSLGRTQWLWGSVPVGKNPVVPDHAGLQWYNPVNAAKEWDLKPVLTKEEGGENNHQVLELNFLPPPDSVGVMARKDWNGVTQVIASVGQDLTAVQFLEIWVNDFHRDHASTQARLHLNFGRMNEDAFWDRRNPPNGDLDTEDKNHDGRLDRPGDADKKDDPQWEDTGLDGLVDWQEPGYDANANPDPNGDDYTYSAEDSPNDHSTINNTEGNGLSTDANARPDTEDLNQDQVLQRENNYFEAVIDLSDSQYVAIDVPDLYAGHEHVDPDNGWRLFRIPITDTTFSRVGAPSWFNIQALRVWVDSMTAPTKLQVGGIELIGSRWLRQADKNVRPGVSLEVLTRNNKDDAIYEAPYGVKNAVGSNAKRREQSLALAYSGLGDGDSVFAFKTYGEAGTGLGWAQYQELKFYVHGQTGVEAESLRVVARFGPDTVNYYEYSTPVKTGWQSIAIPMERLSGLKERRAGQQLFIDRETGAALGTGEVFAVAGNPSFTRLTRVSFGLTVDGTPAATPNGEVWIDELRLSDVRKDRGFSSHAVVQASFADVLSMSASYDRQDQDFFRVGAGTSLGSGFNHTALGLSSTLYLDKLAPTAGFNVPISVSAAHSSDVPKFRTGSDVILGQERSNLETREFNSRSASVGYRRTAPRKGISRYTLDAISGDARYAQDGSVSPQGMDSSWAFSTNATYSIPIGGDGVRLGPVQINPIPRTLDLTTRWTSTRNVNYSRTLSDTADVQALRSDVKRRDLVLRLGTQLEPLSGIRMGYTLESTRDMLQHRNGGPFGKNVGTEVAHVQNVTLNYKPRWFSLFLPSGVNATGSYTERASFDRRSGTGPTNLKDISNAGAIRIPSFVVPISRLGGRRLVAARDTSGSFSLLTPVRFLFSKVQDIQTSMEMSRGTNLTQVTGSPGLPFVTGFTQVFRDDNLNLSTNSIFQTARRYAAAGNTSFKPINTLNFDVRGDYQLSFADSYGSRRTSSMMWPEVNGRWSDLQRLLGLNGTLGSLTLNSGIRRRTEETGPKGGLVEQRTETFSLSPLLGWEASFRNGIRLTATSRADRTKTSNDEVPGYFQERRSKSTSITLNKNFPASKGIKFPWSKKRVRLPNDLNLGGNIDFSADQLLLHQRTGEYPQSDTQSLTVRSQNNYNFSQAISGGFNMEFGQSNDRKTNVLRRHLALEFTGSFRF